MCSCFCELAVQLVTMATLLSPGIHASHVSAMVTAWTLKVESFVTARQVSVCHAWTTLRDHTVTVVIVDIMAQR